MEALDRTRPITPSSRLFFEEEKLAPSAQVFNDKLAEVKVNLTTIHYPFAEKLIELEAILMGRLNRFVKEDALTNRKLSLIESYSKKLNYLYLESGLTLSEEYNELSLKISAQRELLDLKLMAEDPSCVTPELLLVYTCNSIIESITSPVEFPNDYFRQHLQSMYEVVESFLPSLTEFEECERLILIESFQNLFFRELTSVYEKAEITSFPTSVEELLSEIISELNEPKLLSGSRILLLETCRVVFFAHTPKDELPFPIPTIPYMNFRVLKYHISHGAKPSETALAKRIPLINYLLDQISSDDPLAMRRFRFIKHFITELHVIYDLFRYAVPLPLFVLEKDLFIKLQTVRFPDRNSTYYSESYIEQDFALIKDLIDPAQYYNLKTDTYSPGKTPDIYDPEFQKKVMFFVRNIRKDLENLKTGLGTLTFIELRLLQKILEII